MSTSLATHTRNAALSAIITDAGSTAYLWVWTGPPPAKVGTAFVAPTGTLLAKFQLANPIAPAPAAGVLTFNTIPIVTGLNTGTPQYYRITSTATDTDGSTVVTQGSAGINTGDLSFASLIAANGTVGISSFTYGEGNP